MIYFLKHFKGIAYFLIMLILFQSCVAYNKNTSTIEEASSENDMPIKIITKDGNEYKLRWIEEKDGNIVSIKNLEREYFNKNKIINISVLEPEPHVIPLDLALKSNSTVRVVSIDEKGKYISHEFVRISENDDIITGYKMTKKDTLTVIIPIDQIQIIQLKSKGKSAAGTVGLFLGVALFVGFVSMIISFSNGNWWD